MKSSHYLVLCLLLVGNFLQAAEQGQDILGLQPMEEVVQGSQEVVPKSLIPKRVIPSLQKLVIKKLHDAVDKGKQFQNIPPLNPTLLDVVERLRPKENGCDRLTDTLLEKASFTNNRPLVNALVAGGILGVVDEDGNSPLHRSFIRSENFSLPANNKFLDLLKTLVALATQRAVERNGLDSLELLNNEGETVLEKIFITILDDSCVSDLPSSYFVQYFSDLKIIINQLLAAGCVPPKNVLHTILGESKKPFNFRAISRLVALDQAYFFTEKDDQGRTPFEIIISKDHLMQRTWIDTYLLDFINKSLEHGIDINTTNDKGDTFLHSALKAKKTALVKHLLARGCNLNVSNKEGVTPLQLAMSKDLLVIATDLVEAGALIPDDPSIKKRLLLRAIQFHRHKLLNALLDTGLSGIHIDSSSKSDPCFLAIETVNSNALKKLLDAQIVPNNREYFTGLLKKVLSTEQTEKDFVEPLLFNAPAITVSELTTQEMNYLFDMLVVEGFTLLPLIDKHSITFEQVDEKKITSALFDAIVNKNNEAVIFLLNAGADTSKTCKEVSKEVVKSYENFTPLDYAKYLKADDIVQTLNEHSGKRRKTD